MTAGARILKKAAFAAALWLPASVAMGEEAAPSLTQFDRWYNGLWALALFAALLLLLRKLAWKPLVRVIADREESIRAALREAETRRAESEKLLAEYRGKLETAQQEIAAMLAESMRKAEAARQHMLDDARQGAASAVSQAQREIDLAKRETMEEIYRTTADLAAGIAQKILGREINPDDHRRLVTESVQAIRSQE
jgi:F-type H+-transporting ATPase subunit b